MSAIHKYFTSESVTEGHPDKICDKISDSILDAVISRDKNARVACETIVTTGMALVMGEISTEDAYVDIPAVVRETVRQIGYTDSHAGFDCNSCAVLTSIDEQSRDIAMGVNSSSEHKNGNIDKYSMIGAGDQGMMFGFACTETPSLMPAPIYYAHKLTKRLADVRKNNVLPFLLPDGKAQVTVEYSDNGTPTRFPAVVVSAQHIESVSEKEIRDAIFAEVIAKAVPSGFIDKDAKIYINPTGRFVTGGPQGDSGLTGRKIIVDTYGGFARHGGGSFSGKDPTKVDRSAAYMARYIAKNIVAAGLAEYCELEIAYAIGVAHPVCLIANTFGTGVMSDERLSALISEKFDLRPAAIIEKLDLLRPIYADVSAYGHFGRDDLDLTWETLDAVPMLSEYK